MTHFLFWQSFCLCFADNCFVERRKTLNLAILLDPVLFTVYAYIFQLYELFIVVPVLCNSTTYVCEIVSKSEVVYIRALLLLITLIRMFSAWVACKSCNGLNYPVMEHSYLMLYLFAGNP